MTLLEVRDRIQTAIDDRPFTLTWHVPPGAGGGVHWEARWCWKGMIGAQAVAVAHTLKEVTLAVEEAAEQRFKYEETQRKIQKDIDEDRQEQGGDDEV